jgi:hypothetical protein
VDFKVGGGGIYGTPKSLYDSDFYAWTQKQAKFIEDGTIGKLDLVHVQEELQLMGATERPELGK